MMSRRALSSVPRTLSTISRPFLARTGAPILRPAATQLQRRSYHEKVLDHYSNPRNVGSMDKSLSDVGTGKSEPTVFSPCKEKY
jgi:iron-sulfur cluster assembly enzyme ISCU, mitochondrial